MRFTRGIFFGFVIGTVIGLLIYLRLKRENAESSMEGRPLRIHLPDTHRESPPTPLPSDDPQPPLSPAKPLEVISGIGQVRADRLREGGIHSLADLASATPEKIQEILGPRVSLDSATAFIEAAKNIE